MNLIVNTILIKSIISKLVEKNLRQKLDVKININIDELEIKNHENEEEFKITLRGNIKDSDLIQLMIKNKLI